MHIKCFEDILEERKVLLRRIRDNIKRTYPEAIVYIFGSYAKGRVRETSDIDILVKYEEDFSTKEAREVRYKIEDNLIEEFGYEPEIQIVFYNKDKFEEHSHLPGLAGNISKYMMEIEG